MRAITMVLTINFNHQQQDKDLGDYMMQGLESVEYKKRGGRLYVSDSTLCEKKAVLASNELTYESDGFKSFYTEQGKTAERVALTGLDNSGLLMFADYKTPDIGINIGGKIDAIVYYKERVQILEIKQIGSLPVSPIKDHIAQTVFYSALLGLPAILLYLDRKIEGFNTGLLRREFVMDTSFENRRKYLERAVKGYLYNKEKLIPLKPDYMKKSYCTRCDYQEKCWGKDEDYSLWLEQGFSFASFENSVDIQKTCDTMILALLNETVLRDRTTGVLNYLQKYSTRKITKEVLGGSWDSFYG